MPHLYECLIRLFDDKNMRTGKVQVFLVNCTLMKIKYKNNTTKRIHYTEEFTKLMTNEFSLHFTFSFLHWRLAMSVMLVVEEMPL